MRIKPPTSPPPSIDWEIADAIQHLNAVWTRVNAGATVADLADLYAAAIDKPWGDDVPRLTFQWELDWWRENDMDPGAGLSSLRVPVTAFFGENDEVVPPSKNVPLLARYLAASLTGDYAVTILPGANHQMMTGENYYLFYLTGLTAPPPGPASQSAVAPQPSDSFSIVLGISSRRTPLYTESS